MNAAAIDFVLASSSPRRRALLEAAGYKFRIVVPDDSAECGMCSGESPAQLVARYAFRKAQNVAGKTQEAMILAADTVADCDGRILGKPASEEHAREMLRLLSGRQHSVCSGICLYDPQSNRCVVEVARTHLSMQALSDSQLEGYLDSGLWEGKAGAFGYQDGNDWLQILEGSESNVVGLPMELLGDLLSRFESIATPVSDSLG